MNEKYDETLMCKDLLDINESNIMGIVLDSH